MRAEFTSVRRRVSRVRTITINLKAIEVACEEEAVTITVQVITEIHKILPGPSNNRESKSPETSTDTPIALTTTTTPEVEKGEASGAEGVETVHLEAEAIHREKQTETQFRSRL